METTKIYRYRPAYADKEITMPDYGIEVFYSVEQKTAIMYVGKKGKHEWFHRFATPEKMILYINEKITQFTTWIDKRKTERGLIKEKTAALVASDHFKVGDIIQNTWGYEQTNQDFYQVTDVLNKKIRVKEIGVESRYPEGFSSMSCHVTPVKDSFLENGDEYLLSLKVSTYGGTAHAVICNPQSFYYMHVWDGREHYKSWYN